MDDLGRGAPDPGEIELSVFGAGVGESLVIHTGNGDWGLVDSCRNPASGGPVAIEYLTSMGVPAEKVRFILATHWHDDHINGLAESLTAFPNAMFGCSSAYRGAEFAAVTQEYPRSLKTSGVLEMRECFEILEGRPRDGASRPNPKRVLEHQRVWWSDDDRVLIYALAPTSGAITRAEQDILHELLPRAQARRSVGRITPNQASVVISVQTSDDALLLGGDLEEERSAGNGWSAVVQRAPPDLRNATVFKVPHHGSVGAHYDGQWTGLLADASSAVAVLTSFTSSGLPRSTDLRRISGLAGETYVCGEAGKDRPALTTPERRALARDGISVDPIGGLGHVRLRKPASASSGTWTVQLNGHARRVYSDSVSTVWCEARCWAEDLAGLSRGRCCHGPRVWLGRVRAGLVADRGERARSQPCRWVRFRVLVSRQLPGEARRRVGARVVAASGI